MYILGKLIFYNIITCVLNHDFNPRTCQNCQNKKKLQSNMQQIKAQDYLPSNKKGRIECNGPYSHPAADARENDRHIDRPMTSIPQNARPI